MRSETCAEGNITPTPVTLHLSDPFDGIFTLMVEDTQGMAPEIFALPTTP
jgi:hypothetical protein